jgi:hypothetical protein
MQNTPSQQIIELSDSWLLPLDGQVVTCSYAFPGLILDLSGHGRSYSIRINGDAIFQELDAKHRVDADKWSNTAPDLINVFRGKTVWQGYACKDGRLLLRFEDDTELEVLSDPKYESWELSGTGDLRVIGCPGGELAIWKALPGRN